jgi:CheY-like chemotaxis protein
LIWVFPYDENLQDLDATCRQLEVYGFGPSERRPFSNRIELFEAIEGTQHTVVALIDLQSDERTDNNYSGHRVIDTIRRHPQLRERCVPIAYTAHPREDVIALARDHGASALISKIDLDVADIEPLREPLREFLEHQRDLLPRAGSFDPGAVHGFPVFPDIERARERIHMERENMREIVDSLLRRDAKILRQPYFWPVVRYFARGLDQASVARWINFDWEVPLGTVTKALDDLGQSLAPQYRIPNLAWQQFACDLLARVPHQRLALHPSSIELIRGLPPVGELEGILRDPALRRASYLDDAALQAIDLVVDPLMGVGATSGHVGAWKQADELMERLCDLEPDEHARMALRVDFVRAVSNMYDTYLASQALV